MDELTGTPGVHRAIPDNVDTAASLYPPAVARRLLEQRRRDGVIFSEAWPSAVAVAIVAARPGLERDYWRYALDDTAGAWQAAYDRAGPRLKLSEHMAHAA